MTAPAPTTPSAPPQQQNISILVVEDEDSFLEPLVLTLQREEFAVRIARDGIEALDQFEVSPPDLVLLDLMLPRLSGIDVCRRIRAVSTVPIIMVTAKTSEIDVVLGLELGADDYVTKPYRLRELVARIRATLRRRRPEHGASETGEVLEAGELSVDIDRHEVWLRGAPIRLPLKEFELLGALMANVGRVIARHNLIEQVWGLDYEGDTKTLDVHVKRLRARIEDDPSSPTRLVTIRGVGYKMTLASTQRRPPEPPGV